ncbi:hypothetical protein INT48_008178 [Thamnidium elegans]|uniref:Uncharacterized protein n=1 Tax=Thamnidium elegans TaxID=101142 RepID=A0A8H7SWR3_9FUNG|nr:hypothetical protein INT48_008178 [Thamnidium elegans]
MSESRFKRSWRNRFSQQITNFHLNSCISPNISHEDEPLSASSSTPTNKKLWRKPLPNDCPVFDFSSEKTTVIETTDPLEEKVEIPTRYESKYYTMPPTPNNLLFFKCGVVPQISKDHIAIPN